MPYVDRIERDRLHKILDEARKAEIGSVGNLNYLITSLCFQYLSEKGESYQVFNDLIGALEVAKLELYRRQVSEYEDFKKALNGDVYVKRKE